MWFGKIGWGIAVFATGVVITLLSCLIYKFFPGLGKKEGEKGK